MIGRERRMLLRHYLEQGASKSALARQLGISRDTIHRWIRAGDLDRDLDTTPVRSGHQAQVDFARFAFPWGVRTPSGTLSLHSRLPVEDDRERRRRTVPGRRGEKKSFAVPRDCPVGGGARDLEQDSLGASRHTAI